MPATAVYIDEVARSIVVPTPSPTPVVAVAQQGPQGPQGPTGPAGPGGGDVSQAVILAPTTTARNVIEPTASQVTALTLKASTVAGGVYNILRVASADGTDSILTANTVNQLVGFASRWQIDSDANSYWTGRGAFGSFGQPTNPGSVTATALSAASRALVARGFTGQTEAVMEVRNSADANLFRVAANGNVLVNSVGGVFAIQSNDGGPRFTFSDTGLAAIQGRTGGFDTSGGFRVAGDGGTVVIGVADGNTGALLRVRANGPLQLENQGSQAFRSTKAATYTNVHLVRPAADDGLYGADGAVFIGNGAAAPSTNPVNGGVLYAEAGALKWRGSGGTVTTIATA